MMQKYPAELTNRLAVSEAELKRRLDVTQAALKKEGIDCLVVQAHSYIFDANIRYFTDARASIQSSTLVVPANGKILMIGHGPDNENAPIVPWVGNVERSIANHSCLSFAFTDENIGKLVEKEISSRGYKKVAFAGLQLMGYSFGSYLTRNLPNVEFVDFSDQLAGIQAVKSAEEWELVNLAIVAHDKLNAAIPAMLRPGRYEFEIAADINLLASNLGCERMGNLGISSYKPGEPSRQFGGSRKIQYGDYIQVLTEAAGPGGMYGEIARIFSFGKPADALVEVWELSREVQHLVAAASKPGATGADLSRVYDEFATKHGLPPNKRYIGHGQGYDMMQSPSMNPYDDMELKEDMLLAIHPPIGKDTFSAMCCDNFRVTRSGGVLLQTTPQEITII